MVGMRIADRPEFSSKPKPLTFPADAMVFEAVQDMAARDYGSVVIVDENEKLIGLVTERDILKRLVGAGLDAKSTPLSAIMTTELRVARADDELIPWLRIMSNERFRRLPVVDDDNRVIAIMTQGDFVSYTWPDLIYQAKEVTKATISSNYQIFLVFGALLVYTFAILAFLRWGSEIGI